MRTLTIIASWIVQIFPYLPVIGLHQRRSLCLKVCADTLSSILHFDIMPFLYCVILKYSCSFRCRLQQFDALISSHFFHLTFDSSLHWISIATDLSIPSFASNEARVTNFFNSQKNYLPILRLLLQVSINLDVEIGRMLRII